MHTRCCRTAEIRLMPHTQPESAAWPVSAHSARGISDRLAAASCSHDTAYSGLVPQQNTAVRPFPCPKLTMDPGKTPETNQSPTLHATTTWGQGRARACSRTAIARGRAASAPAARASSAGRGSSVSATLGSAPGGAGSGGASSPPSRPAALAATQAWKRWIAGLAVCSGASCSAPSARRQALYALLTDPEPPKTPNTPSVHGDLAVTPESMRFA